MPGPVTGSTSNSADLPAGVRGSCTPACSSHVIKMDPDLPAGVLLLPSWAKVGAGARSWDSPKTGICPSAFGFLPSVSSSLVSLFFFFLFSLSFVPL